MTESYPRDLRGHGAAPPDPRWPGDARIAVQFVLNYEEGGENNILHGDAASEAFLSEIVGARPWAGRRHMNMESLYEYGARAGFWRIRRLFEDRGVPLTIFGVATALERSPEQVAAMRESNWEIACHGLKWIDYAEFDKAAEREHMARAILIHERVTGERPLGWYTGRASEHTTELVVEEGGFLYSADSYADDLPYWLAHGEGPQLMVPYTLDANDMRFATPQGFNAGSQFLDYLKDSFDVLYREGVEGAPRMMSIGLHCRLVGRPGRAAALARFLDHVQGHDSVWLARRIDIARHWHRYHPPAGIGPSGMNEAMFAERFGDVFENTPEIARDAHRAGLGPAEDTAKGLHAVLVKAMRGLDDGARRRLIEAHPDLAGRLALGRALTAESAGEQATAGLDRLSEAELRRFTELNEAYRARFGFPFVMAVKGCDKAEILAAYDARLAHDADTETTTALAEIEKIALLRLRDRLPPA